MAEAVTAVVVKVAEATAVGATAVAAMEEAVMAEVVPAVCELPATPRRRRREKEGIAVLCSTRRLKHPPLFIRKMHATRLHFENLISMHRDAEGQCQGRVDRVMT
jgi:hypothetical protein